MLTTAADAFAETNTRADAARSLENRVMQTPLLD
jgi:hypothetical protein